MNKSIIKFAIVEIVTVLNRNEKLTIKCVEGKEQNATGVFQLTPAHMNRLAESVRALNADMLADAVAQSLDTSFLVAECSWNKAGDPVLDDNGQQVIDKEGKPQFFTKDHWSVRNFELELGEEAIEYIAGLNARVNEAMLMKVREEKMAKEAKEAKRRAAMKGEVAPKEAGAPEDAGADSTATPEDSPL